MNGFNIFLYIYGGLDPTIKIADATLNCVSSINAEASVTKSASATLSCVSTVNPTATVDHYASATLNCVATITADATVSSGTSAFLACVSTVNATGSITKSASASLSCIATITATGEILSPFTIDIVCTSTLNCIGTKITPGPPGPNPFDDRFSLGVAMGIPFLRQQEWCPTVTINFTYKNKKYNYEKRIDKYINVMLDGLKQQKKKSIPTAKIVNFSKM